MEKESMETSSHHNYIDGLITQANSFTPEDRKGVTFPHEDALIIFTVIFNCRVHQVLVNDGSAVNIYSMKVII